MTTKNAKEILRMIARESAMPLAQIQSPTRQRETVFVRQRCAAVLREIGLSYRLIGELIDRDESTVLRLVKKAHIRYGSDPEYFSRLAYRLTDLLAGGDGIDSPGVDRYGKRGIEQ